MPLTRRMQDAADLGFDPGSIFMFESLPTVECFCFRLNLV